ncbi:hypothetical protein O3G_MSEX002154 [Manduca sexta]|uniref:Transcription termination factor 2 n=1 Tax=Manduca sexta TaxID=7130 RepID=A0A921YMD2_MANSE|nr:hypothetical protein O3G_MSEX002154 [Manduca sexta]
MMENSFFEYRDKTGVDSGSDSEVIDDSLVADNSLSAKKKDHTVFVPESDESLTDDESQSDEDIKRKSSKVKRQSNVSFARSRTSGESTASSSRQSRSHNEIVLSSDEEEQDSPELIPRRPPSTKKTILNTPILHKNKKRMLFDSDLDNSIVIEHNKNKKMSCLKNTPLKNDTSNQPVSDNYDMLSNDDDLMSNDNDDGNTDGITDDKDGDSSDDQPLSNLKKDKDLNNYNTKELDDSDNHEVSVTSKADDDMKYSTDSDADSNVSKDDHDDDSNVSKADHDDDNHSDNRDKNDDHYDSNDVDSDGDEVPSDDEYASNRKAIIDSDDEVRGKSAKKPKGRKVIHSDDSDGIDEDQMVMSRATRMSIMGYIPKGNDSDESDFIQSDESHRKSRNSGSTNSLSELPDIDVGNKSPIRPVEPSDTSRLTCSPFTSPRKDITNEIVDSTETSPKEPSKPSAIDTLKNTLHKRIDKVMVGVDNDDDVTIIDTVPEIIALSSDDDEVSIVQKSPRVKKSPKPKQEDVSPKKKDNTIRSYLVPPSYPNQGVVYVSKHVRENELRKLNSLKEDLHNVKNLLEQIDINTLPDGGVKYIERLTGLEAEVRRQGDKVANMVVEPENPTVDDVKNDGFEKGLTWDEIQKASNAVQPRMFGKQAMSTHMAERNLILERLRDLHESLASRPPESELAAAPAGVATRLMPHQLHALAWLRWRETQRPAGGILADDMGLGKTITMISLIVSDKEKNIDDDDSDDERPGKGGKLHSGGTLVVCPASLMQQWAGEVTRHCAPHALRVLLHHGPSRPTQPQRLAGYDLVVTTYNILQREDEKTGVLMRLRWRRVILDEAHIVRNHKAATSLAVSALRARRRWCLTGTPVQNKDLDLFALIKFLRCTPFDDLTMWKKWIDNKSLGGQERLSTVMRCLLLRRTKQQLQQRGQLSCLPERDTHQRHVTLTKQEMNVYQKVLVFSKTLFAQFLHQRAEKNSDALGVIQPDKESDYNKMHKKMIALQGAKPVKSHEILVLLLRLRQVCCHCGLIAAMLDEEGAGEVEEDPAGKDLLAELNKLSLEDSAKKRRSGQNHEPEEEGPEEGTTAAEAIRSVLSPNNPVFELDKPSSKIQAVMQCLNENVFVNKGHKAAVVSQWTSVLRLVERELVRVRVRCVTLSGAVPVPARPPLINAINDPNSDVRVMLLSLCAGGVGLNLCGANHLLLLDPHWNPQLEEQAQDRIYRVGQTKHVHIYRFMCVDTVEQAIRKLQQAKLDLADNILTGARHTNASKLTIEDLKMLFNMGPQ